MRQPTRGSMDMKVFGAEPETYNGIETLNWFTYFADRQDYREWFQKYLKKNKMNKRCDRIPQHYAVMAYFAIKKKNIADNYIDKLNTFIESLDDNVCTTQSRPTISIQGRIDKQVALFGGVLDGVIDERNYKKFDITKWAGDIKSVQARKLLKSIEYKLNDVEMDDEFSKEGYSYLKKSELLEYKEFLKNVKSTLFSKTVQQPRKARIKKPISAGKKVSKLKYMKMDSKSGIKSQNPENIIDAKGLLTYNTKTRTLHYFESDAGFDVKGTTLINFLEEKSYKQKVRKPDEFLANKTFPKTKMNKINKEITTKKSSTKGRINSDMLILAIYK